MSKQPRIAKKPCITIEVGAQHGSLTVRFYADGWGEVVSNDIEGDREDFLHSYPVTEDLQQLQYRDICDLYEDRFWNDVNPTLDDPFVQGDELEDWPVEWNGDAECFERMFRAFVITDPDITLPAEFEIVATTQDEESYVTADFPSQLTPRLLALSRALLAEAHPYGWTWQYNDGQPQRLSGWSMTAEAITIEVEPPTAHERAEAHLALQAWLLERRSAFSAKELALIEDPRSARARHRGRQRPG